MQLHTDQVLLNPAREKTFEGGVSLLASAGGIILSMLTELVVQDVSLLLIE